VLASTEDTWAQIFTQAGQRYQPAGFIFYGGRGQSGCGAAQAAMGPFYCPTDNKIYVDTSFYKELQNRFGAAGDFAQAYVIAHEVGHHIQQVTGVLDKARQAQQSLSTKEGNAVQVLVELQADCYAGVWAGRNRERLEPGDVQEGMRAAEAIGDDALQMKRRGGWCRELHPRHLGAAPAMAEAGHGYRPILRSAILSGGGSEPRHSRKSGNPASSWPVEKGSGTPAFAGVTF
jgi:predicted metalloprotease